MPENGNGNKFISYKILVYAMATLLLIALTGVVTDTRSSVTDVKAKTEQLQKDKVDKEQYCRDIQEIKQGINLLTRMHLSREK